MCSCSTGQQFVGSTQILPKANAQSTRGPPEMWNSLLNNPTTSHLALPLLPCQHLLLRSCKKSAANWKLNAGQCPQLMTAPSSRLVLPEAAHATQTMLFSHTSKCLSQRGQCHDSAGSECPCFELYSILTAHWCMHQVRMSRAQMTRRGSACPACGI